MATNSTLITSISLLLLSYPKPKSVNTIAGSMLLDNEDFLTKYAISFYYTNDLVHTKKYFKKSNIRIK